MKKLSAKGMKALKVVHLVCVIAWFGSAISMNLLRHLVEVEDAGRNVLDGRDTGSH